MSQKSFVSLAFDQKQTRRERFLSEMGAVIPQGLRIRPV
jgi:hypothetical protein